jgi:hypothetical protein
MRAPKPVYDPKGNLLYVEQADGSVAFPPRAGGSMAGFELPGGGADPTQVDGPRNREEVLALYKAGKMDRARAEQYLSQFQQ